MQPYDHMKETAHAMHGQVSLASHTLCVACETMAGQADGWPYVAATISGITGCSSVTCSVNFLSPEAKVISSITLV